jgi:hypothetical protein
MSKKSDEEIIRRAQARAALRGDPAKRPIYIVCCFMGVITDRTLMTTHEDGCPNPHCRPNYEFTRAETQCAGHATQYFERGESESVEEFEVRVIGCLPVVSEYCPVALFFSPNLPEATSALLNVIDTGSPDESSNIPSTPEAVQ